MFDLISQTMRSNLYTMGVASNVDERQLPGNPYEMPGPEVRLLRAKLILEEALETIHALGFRLSIYEDYDDDPTEVEFTKVEHINFGKFGEPDMEKIIDGCCDGIYVYTGTLACCGIPDNPHLQEVNNANDKKFPGRATPPMNDSGKYLKPVGWTPPDHKKVEKAVMDNYVEDLQEIAPDLVSSGNDDNADLEEDQDNINPHPYPRGKVS